MAAKIKVKQVKSKICTTPNQKKNLRALGLRKMDAERIHDDTPVVRGMISKVHHLVVVETVK